MNYSGFFISLLGVESMPLTIPVSQVSTFPVRSVDAPFPPCLAAGCGSDARVCSIDLQTYLFSSVQKRPNPNCRALRNWIQHVLY